MSFIFLFGIYVYMYLCVYIHTHIDSFVDFSMLLYLGDKREAEVILLHLTQLWFLGLLPQATGRRLEYCTAMLRHAVVGFVGGEQQVQQLWWWPPHPGLQLHMS